MSAFETALGKILEHDPSVAIAHTKKGLILYRRTGLLVDTLHLAAARNVFRDEIDEIERLDDLGLFILHLRGSADALDLEQRGTRPSLVNLMHIFTVAHALAIPDIDKETMEQVLGILEWTTTHGNTGHTERNGRHQSRLNPYIDEVQLARIMVQAPELLPGPVASVHLIPYAGHSITGTTPLAIEVALEATPGTTWVAPAGDLSSSVPVYPAASSKVLAVAGTDQELRKLTRTSSWGNWVDLVAPSGRPESSAGTASSAALVAGWFVSSRSNYPRIPVELLQQFAALEGRLVVHYESAAEGSDQYGDGRDNELAWQLGVRRQEHRQAQEHREKQERRREEQERRREELERRGSQWQPGWTSAGDYQDAPLAGPAPRLWDSDDGLVEPAHPPAGRGDGEHWLVTSRILNSSGNPVSKDRCLRTTSQYLFELQLANVPVRSGLTQPAPLNWTAAPPGTRLELWVQPLGPGLNVLGSATKQLILPESNDGEESSAVGSVRFRTSREPGTHQMYGNLYASGRLLQSHLVTIEVRELPTILRGAIRSEVDFNVTSTLDADYISGLDPINLSLTLGTGAGHTHDLVYRGLDQSVVAGGLTLDAASIEHAVTDMRARLREISWGAGTAWNGEPGKYESTVSEDEFFADLGRLALGGYRLWSAMFHTLFQTLERPQVTRQKIRDLTRRPGSIELACRESLRMTIPVALFYDQAIDDAFRPQICSTFADAYRAHADLVQQKCFIGDCPNRTNDRVFCPSAFWGLRHKVGIVRSVSPCTSDASLALATLKGGSVSSAVSALRIGESVIGIAASTTDRLFRRRVNHLKIMNKFFNGRLTVAETRDDTLKFLSGNAAAHVVYFFCHGTVTPSGYPGLVVGPKDGPAITLNNLAERVRWADPRPLVFLNGCQTAALEPHIMFDLVTTLVQECGAAGVVGTETTVFERTAISFAEAFHEAFICHQWPLGEAIRRARLKLLSEGNPLGLVYAPYASVDLHLEKGHSETNGTTNAG